MDRSDIGPIVMIVLILIVGMVWGMMKGYEAGIDRACSAMGYEESEIHNGKLYCVVYEPEYAIIRLEDVHTVSP